MADYITKKSDKGGSKAKEEYIVKINTPKKKEWIKKKKKKIEWIKKKDKETKWITIKEKDKGLAGGGAAQRGLGRAFMKGGRV